MWICIMMYAYYYTFQEYPRDPQVSVWPKAGRTLPSCCWPVPGRVYSTGRGRSLWLWNGIEGREVEGRGHAGEEWISGCNNWGIVTLFHESHDISCRCSPLFGTAAALGWKAPTLCYSAIILNLAILNPARLRGLVPLKPTASIYFKNSGPWAVFFPWQEAAEASQQAMLSVAGLDKDPEQHISCIFLHWLGCVVLLTSEYYW